MRDDDGGAAFPLSNDEAVQYNWINRGMSLRDWFAGQALAGLLSHRTELPYERLAEHAYAAAAAMLAERTKGEP